MVFLFKIDNTIISQFGHRQTPVMQARDKSGDNTERQFKELYRDLHAYHETESHSKNQSKIANLCKKLKQYCQLAVWAQTKNPVLFDFFCENKSLELFYNIFLKSQQKEIMLCVIQSISMLLVSLSQADSVHFILADSFLINMLQVRFTGIDTEMAQYYINMLKTISCKLDSNTIKLFYNQKNPTFPLLWQSIRFHNHPQSLIRNTSRNIVLSIFKLNDPAAKEYLVNFPFVVYYSHIASGLRDTWAAINNVVNAKRGISSQQQMNDTLQMLIDDNLDAIMYVEDLVPMCGEKARRYLLTCYIGQCIVPMIRDFPNPKFKFHQRTVLYLLSVILKNTKIPEVAQIIIIMLFGKYIPKNLSTALMSYQTKEPLSSYNRNWTFLHLWDNHIDVVMRNCRNLVNTQVRPHSVACDPHSPARRAGQLQNGITLDKAPLEREISKIEDWFEVRVACNSRVGLPPRHRIDLLGVLSTMHRDLKQSSFIDLDELEDNKNTNALLKCLDSQDQSIVLLCTNFIEQMLNNKSASHQITTFCGIYTAGFGNNENLKKILKKLLEIFYKRSGRFQTQTFMVLQQLIQKIVKDNQSKLFDETCSGIIKETLRTLVERLTTYTLNISDSMGLLQLYSFAQASINNLLNKRDLQFKALLWDEQSYAVTTLNAQIQSDFAVYLLLNRIKAHFIVGKYNYDQLTQLKFHQTTAPSIIGKQIEFPQNTVVGEFKDIDSGASFKCFILINKYGLLLARKATANKGQVQVNCDLVSICCQLKAAELRRLYFNQSLSQGKYRSFFLVFSDSKICFKIRNLFEECKLTAAKQVVDRLVDTFIKCLQDINSKNNSASSINSTVDWEVSVKQKSPEKKPPAPTQSLIDMWPF